MRFTLPQKGYTNPRKSYHKKRTLARGSRKKLCNALCARFHACKLHAFRRFSQCFVGYSLFFSFSVNVTLESLFALFCILSSVHIYTFLSFLQSFLVYNATRFNFFSIANLGLFLPKIALCLDFTGLVSVPSCPRTY